MQSVEPYDDVVTIIANGFKLRRSDAISRAVRQLKEWNSLIASMRGRGELPSIKAITRHCDEIQHLIKSNVGKYTPRDHSGPTPEQAAKPPKRDSIQSLEDAERLTAEQVSAAREIQRIVELITASCHPRGQSFEKGTAVYRPSGLMMSAETAYRWSQVYVPWHAAMDARSDKRLKRLAEKVILDGISLDSARRGLCMSYERGYVYLCEALEMFIHLRQNNQSPPIE